MLSESYFAESATHRLSSLSAGRRENSVDSFLLAFFPGTVGSCC